MIRLERKRSSSEESDKLGFARSLIIDGPISLGHLHLAANRVTFKRNWIGNVVNIEIVTKLKFRIKLLYLKYILIDHRFDRLFAYNRLDMVQLCSRCFE